MKQKTVNQLEDHWANTPEYDDPGYEGFKTGRRKFLAQKIVDTKPKSVLEIGTLGGYNLREIHKLDDNIELFGFDINKKALKYAKSKCPAINTVYGNAHKIEEAFHENQFDVVFTSGCLIHIPATHIEALINKICDISKNYAFHAEHHGDKRPYRHMRWIHDFYDLYKGPGREIDIQPAPDASNGFEDIITVKLNKIKG